MCTDLVHFSAFGDVLRLGIYGIGQLCRDLPEKVWQSLEISPFKCCQCHRSAPDVLDQGRYMLLTYDGFYPSRVFAFAHLGQVRNDFGDRHLPKRVIGPARTVLIKGIWFSVANVVQESLWDLALVAVAAFCFQRIAGFWG